MDGGVSRVSSSSAPDRYDDDDSASSASGPVASLACRFDSTWLIATTLDAINSDEKSQSVVMKANADGLDLMVVDQCRVLQASARLSSELFPEFRCGWGRDGHPRRRRAAATAAAAAHADADDDEEEEEARISMEFHLPMLLRLLNVFGAHALTTTSLSLKCSAVDKTLRLVLESSGVVSECTLAALAATHSALDAPKDFSAEFREYFPIRAKAILDSSCLHDALIELSGHPGASTVALTLAGTLDDGFLRLATEGSVGTLCVDIPSPSDAFEELTVTPVVEDEDVDATVTQTQNDSRAPAQLPFVTQRYQLKLLQHAFRVLASAKQTYIRINHAGMLCVQHMVPVPATEGFSRGFGKKGDVAGESVFVDFVIYPDENATADAAELEAAAAVEEEKEEEESAAAMEQEEEEPAQPSPSPSPSSAKRRRARASAAAERDDDGSDDDGASVGRRAKKKRTSRGGARAARERDPESTLTERDVNRTQTNETPAFGDASDAGASESDDFTKRRRRKSKSKAKPKPKAKGKAKATATKSKSKSKTKSKVKSKKKPSKRRGAAVVEEATVETSVSMNLEAETRDSQRAEPRRVAAREAQRTDAAETLAWTQSPIDTSKSVRYGRKKKAAKPKPKAGKERRSRRKKG